MTSTRLPGKVMKTVLGKTLLEHLLERLNRCQEIDGMIVATPSASVNQPIWDLCGRKNVPVFKGDENDVLSRYYGAARTAGADHIIRVTSDCPLMDPVELDSFIRFYKRNLDRYDYVSSGLERTYPRGMEPEIFSFAALQQAQEGATLPDEREHVTLYIYRHKEKFKVGIFRYSEDISHHRWTVDTDEDFQLVSKIIETLYVKNPHFTLKDILALLDQHPTWIAINQHVEQKKVTF
jgi:spore coat polysaccharide biosynthesis protein SpsF